MCGSACSSALLACALALAAGFTPLRAAFTSADFLKTDGPVIRSDQGKGRIVTLRGTNLGGWFVQEDWMSPNGFGEIPRERWQGMDGNLDVRAAFDGKAETDWHGDSPAAIFSLDMGRRWAFSRVAIEFVSRPQPLLIETSLDGVKWLTAKTSAAAGRRGTQQVLLLDNVYTARFVRLRPGEGERPLAIAEIRLLQNDDYTVRQTLTARFGARADELLDVYQNTWITAADLDKIQSWGMSVVRVPLNWLEFMEEDGAAKASGWKQLDWIVDECDRRQIYLILDLHAVPGGASPWASSGRAGDDGTGQNPNGFWTNPAFQELTIKLWVKIAARYKDCAAVAGYDLINEPLYRYDETPRQGEKYSEAALKKAALFDRLYRAVRAVDPDHMIFIAAYTVAPPDNSTYIGTPSGFIGITPPSYYGWSNVVYQTHHYDMPNATVHDAQEQLVTTALADIARHQREWNVPIYAGEYSLYGFHDVWAKWMAGLNALHVSWTNWTYKVRGKNSEPGGGNWGFFNSNENEVPDIVADSAEEIAAKWARFNTTYFVRNTALIEVVRKYVVEGAVNGSPAVNVPRAP